MSTSKPGPLKNPALIVTIFTEDATYHERAFDAPMQGREAIRAYWQAKVSQSQSRIACRVLNLYLDGDTAIVEWEAEFDDLVKQVRKEMREVAIITFDGYRISSLREYWSSRCVADLVG